MRRWAVDDRPVGGHETPQERRRAIARVALLGKQPGDDRQDHVEPGGVGALDGSLRVVHTQTHRRVDLGPGCDPLRQRDHGFVAQHGLDTREHARDTVTHLDGRLPDFGPKGQRPRQRPAIGA